jgi:hypothetical protein
MIIATIDITNAFNQPQSKKCFTVRSHIINCAINERKPLVYAPTVTPIIVPSNTINIESVNFAFFLPTNALPESQRDGEIMMILMMICIINEVTLKAILYHTRNHRLTI